jgi:hypothetical protein
MHSTAGKLMLTVFGTLSRDGLNNEQCSLLCDELKPAMKRTTVRKRCDVA